MISTRRELLAFHQALCDESRGLMDKKNQDYTGAACGEDPFFNFRRVVEEGHVGSLAKSVYVRFSDKVARISTLLSKEAAVSDEKLRDTVVDGINYLVLLLAVGGEGGNRESAQEAGPESSGEPNEAEAPGHHLEGEEGVGGGEEQVRVPCGSGCPPEGWWRCHWCSSAFSALKDLEDHERFLHGANLFPT